MRSAIHSYKFAGETARAPHFATLLSDACRELGTDVSLTPVPLHPKRKRQRGYEQTVILAREIGKRTGQPVFTGLRKGRDTPQQVGLSRAERSLNLLDAFELAPGVTVPEQIILIDDVATTGATLTECAIALRNGGATSVSAVVIAHGL
jgi:ComF family protein